MEEEKKENRGIKEVKNNNSYIPLVIFISLLIGLGVWIYSLIDYNSELEAANQEKDSLIESSKLRDSLLAKSTKEYATVITKYINECGFTMDNKPLSSNQLVEMYNRLDSENSLLKDSVALFRSQLNRWKRNYFIADDSLYIYRTKVAYIYQWYGVSLKMEKDSSSKYVVTKNYSKADSALIIYPYVKNYLSRDSVGNLIIKIPQIIRTITNTDKPKKRKK